MTREDHFRTAVVGTYSRPKLLGAAAVALTFAAFAVTWIAAGGLILVLGVLILLLAAPAAAWTITRLWRRTLLVVDAVGVTCSTPRFAASWNEIADFRLRQVPTLYGSANQLVVRFNDPQLLRRKRPLIFNPMLRAGGQAWVPLVLLRERPEMLFEQIVGVAPTRSRRVSASLDPRTWMDR